VLTAPNQILAQLPRGFSTKELAAFFQQLRLGTAPTVAAPHGGIDPGIPTGECSLDVQYVTSVGQVTVACHQKKKIKKKTTFYST